MLSTGILNPDTYCLKHAYPTLNIDNKVLITPAPFFLSNGIYYF